MLIWRWLRKGVSGQKSQKKKHPEGIPEIIQEFIFFFFFFYKADVDSVDVSIVAPTVSEQVT